MDVHEWFIIHCQEEAKQFLTHPAEQNPAQGRLQSPLNVLWGVCLSKKAPKATWTRSPNEHRV